MFLKGSSAKHQSNTFTSDRCLIHVDPRVFPIWTYPLIQSDFLTSQSCTTYYMSHDNNNAENWSDHDGIIKWKHFPCYWPFVWGIHQSPVNSPHKGQWHGGLMFSLICTWIISWVNNHEAGDLRCHRTHYDISVMYWTHRKCPKPGPLGQTMEYNCEYFGGYYPCYIKDWLYKVWYWYSIPSKNRITLIHHLNVGEMKQRLFHIIQKWNGQKESWTDRLTGSTHHIAVLCIISSLYQGLNISW